MARLGSMVASVIGGTRMGWADNIMYDHYDGLGTHPDTVVDDEPQIVKLVASRLSANGYEVVSAYDGEEGVQKALEENPDLILLDVLMPKLDGCGAAVRLKGDERTKDIPIILLTAVVSKDEEGRDVRFASSVCVAKPFEEKELLQKVSEQIRK